MLLREDQEEEAAIWSIRMTPPITIVERTTGVGVLGHLDELERLMREYKEVRISENSPTDDVLRDLYLSSFLYWLQQRERQSVAGELNVERD